MHVPQKFYLAFFGLIIIVFQAPGGVPDERLILFVQNKPSAVDHAFRGQIPELRQLAETNKLEFSVINIDEHGAPDDVTITPLIVFQNYRGRSIYQGRINTLSRVQNFIQTSRFVAQGDVANERRNIPIWQIGRTRVWSPLKIAPVTGTPPPGYDHDRFVDEATKSISKGFRRFKLRHYAALGRSDRGFYMDFYPWLSEDGTLFLSLALFSQFHCKDPVFELKDDPITGPWRKRKALFRRAAAYLEEAVMRSLEDTTRGDGFDAIGRNVTSATWDQLGLSLPAPPSQHTRKIIGDQKLPRRWILDARDEQRPPLVRIRFPAPLDNYSGFAHRGTAALILSEDLKIEGALGDFTIDPKSVTMGDVDLDDAIQGSLFLNTKRYPESKFNIDSISGDGQALAFGRLTAVEVTGRFYLKDKVIEMRPSMEVEPIVGLDGTPRLLVRGSFNLNLRTFNIEEAEGPEPARHTVLIDYHFALKPDTLAALD